MKKEENEQQGVVRLVKVFRTIPLLHIIDVLYLLAKEFFL